MADIGYITLVIALPVALYSALASFIGARVRRPELVASARNGVYALCCLLSLAAAVLLYALFSHDFQLSYVASYSSRDMSPLYILSAFYAGNEGSLLLWVWLLSICGAVVAWQGRHRSPRLMPYVYSVVMATQLFFLLLTFFVANPFEKLPFVAAEGRGLNPLLENPGMLLHPPALLAGYVGFTIPFAFAIAALASGRLGGEWLARVRGWALLSWLLLGVGNLLGAQWAYVELGWGGYWAWDPVENAGLMPWLVATAFLHSSTMQLRRGMLKTWNMVLVILTFVLVVFGTFLTRSGVLSSVHTFAESGTGPFFLAFISISLVGSLALVVYRRRELKGEDELDSWVSRESSFLLNNVVLVGAAFAIFLGTVFPVLSEAVRGVKVSVGAPFFNQVNAPIFLLLILLMGICPLIGWRRASLRNLLRNFLYPLVAAIAVAVLLASSGIGKWYVIFAFSICGFVFTAIGLEWIRGIRARRRTRRENFVHAFFKLIWGNRPRYGGYIVHLAIILIAIGVIGSTAYKVERDATLAPGESMSIKNYTLTYEGMSQYPARSKQVVAADLSVYNGERFVGTMTPEKYFHQSYEQPVTEVAIRSNLIEDLYVILAGWDEKSAAFKVLVNPLVSWIWVGGVVLLLGTVIAFWPERGRGRL